MSATVAPLRSFELRAWARAFLLRECVFASFAEAFIPLFNDAERDGLLRQHGFEALLQIVVHTCHSAGVRVDPWSA